MPDVPLCISIHTSYEVLDMIFSSCDRRLIFCLYEYLFFRSRGWKDFRACNIPGIFFNVTIKSIVYYCNVLFLYTSILIFGGKPVTAEQNLERFVSSKPWITTTAATTKMGYNIGMYTPYGLEYQCIMHSSNCMPALCGMHLFVSPINM